MNKTRTFFQALMLPLTLWLAAYSANLRAEDIDIYVDNAGASGAPNVLFVIDNGANFSADAKIGCSSYKGTTEAPALGTSTAAGIIQCALVDALNSLPNGALNIGILVSNANNFANDTRSTSDAAYHERCETDLGGCLLRKLTFMESTSKANMVKFIKSWKSSGLTDASNFNVKVNTALPGTMMQEAWAYYNGKTGMSGKSYAPSVLHGCQRNFVIYIANTEKSPATESPSPFDGANAMTSTQVGATTAQKTKIKEKVTFNPATCGVTEKNYSNDTRDWSENWADEWARLMYQQDGGTSTMEGNQNIITYSIGITNDATCTPDYPALLSTMAKYGGGKYFKVGDASDMTNALMAALNEVQAVNSVFSSASLPVSVNAEGSYLNQIFLGMFRPDSTGAPRWVGNLKQYQLVRNSVGSLVMGDATGKAALSSGGTGFLAPDAVSFWTYRDDNVEPDKSGGYFANNPMGTPVSPYDRADGEVVEKGGVAQQLRKANLTATFSGASGDTGNPRRLFTYCPQGTGCNSDLTNAANDFATSNTSISAAAFGSAVTVPVVSIVRNGSTALVTTAGNHGFTGTSVVTIRNANQAAYNVTQSVTVNSSTTFTISNLPDYPTSPSQGTYTVSKPNTSTSSFAISALSRATSTSGNPVTEKVTVTTSGNHGFVTGDSIKIAGMEPKEYNGGSWTVTGTPAADQLTFSVPIYPVASTKPGNYQFVRAPYTVAIKGITYFKSGSTRTWTVETSPAHGLHKGQTVTIAGTAGAIYNATWTVDSIVSTTQFTIVPVANPDPGSVGAGGTVAPSTIPKSPTVSLKREGSTVATTARVDGMPADWFADGDEVKITALAPLPNESDYYIGTVKITCISGTSCSSFTYPITASPAPTATSLGTVSPSAGSATILPTNIKRIGADLKTAQVSGIPPGTFNTGTTVDIAASGATLSSESAYVGTWKIDCGADLTCASFTFGPVILSPDTPATGTNIQAYSGNTAPDKDLLIKWLRGQDNAGDEKGPGGTVTVRPSVHGDVLHSRPLVINYGDSRGIVVFYGSNDGVYRAVNGNQASAINGVPAGGELWGLILPDHYGLINRYRANAPELKFPSSFLASAQPKDYFVDGPTGVYQKLKADGTIDKAYIYLTMRRGGRFIYALDVTEPYSPKVLWSISHQVPGFEELGQTWSRPRVTLLQNLRTTGTTTSPATPIPVLVFGAGYDSAQDDEPPSGDDQGRGIFVVNALTGALIWSASKTCDPTLYPCVKVDDMKYATPSDIAFVDRDLNGFIDKFYWGDLGGNVWRADVSDADPLNWRAKRIARLGCDSGECSTGTTPRKFFFPPAILSIRAAGATDSYEAISIVSGDREHPLRSTSTASSYNVQDKFFMIKDLGTTLGGSSSSPSTTDVSGGELFDATYDLWDGSQKGFFISLVGNPATGDKGEKGVNAPIAVNGQIFFSTNRPVNRSNTCAVNLGEARAYAVSPFTGAGTTNVLQGGGMPPSAVTGLISITEIINGVTTTTQEKFCIGCGVSSTRNGSSGTSIGDERNASIGSGGGNTTDAPCVSGLDNCYSGSSVLKNLKRTYWYKK